SPDKELGSISNYFVERYGFSPEAKILPWSGDNPCSMVGLGLDRDGDMAISFGTSDTVFVRMNDIPEQSPENGHIFCTPTGAYMALLCYSNGSLAREKVRDKYGLDWSSFNEAVARKPAGNNGGVMLSFPMPEITPHIGQSKERYVGISETDIDAQCRGIYEAHALAKKHHVSQMGLKPTCLKVTGGASKDTVFMQILADVFQCPVDRMDSASSAAIGAALVAAKTIMGEKALTKLRLDITKASHRLEPDSKTKEIYKELLALYEKTEKEIVS
ncbi:MAG: carbohydrate kinase, partial [Planctomycetes bacterium]|nr:carbohydrate kinase [Planctomycetota bacterium]